MINIRCPYCQAIVAVAPDVAGRVYPCPQCGKPMRVPEPANPAAPLAGLPEPEAGPGSVAGVENAIEVHAPRHSVLRKHAWEYDPAVSESAVWRQFLASPIVRQAVSRFAHEPLPHLAIAEVAPLPEETPPAADELGEPLASVYNPGASRVANIVATAFLLTSGLICVVSSILSIFLATPQRGEPPPFLSMLLVGLPLLGTGVWMLFFRRPDEPKTMWVCPHGLIWQQGRRMGCCLWHELPGLYVSMETSKPWFRLDFTVMQTWLSPGLSPNSGVLGEYIEMKASAALIPAVLKRIAQGESVRFGGLTLDRHGLRWQRAFCEWSLLQRATTDNVRIYIDQVGRPGWVSMRFRDIPFAAAALALANIMIKEPLPELPASEGPESIQ